MAVQLISRMLIYTSILSNIVLGGVIFTRLQVAPADVLLEVRSIAAAQEVRSREADDRFQELAKVVAERGAVIQDIQNSITAINAQAGEYMYRSEFRQWCEEVKERHPEFDIPVCTDPPVAQGVQ